MSRMNFLTLGARSLKKAIKAKLEQEKLNELYNNNEIDPNYVFDLTLKKEAEFMEQAFDIGMEYYQMAKRKLGSTTDNSRHYMLTIRPTNDTSYKTLEHYTNLFITTWKSSWNWAEWAYEQKGTTKETLGFGVHVHIIICTTKNNYYPSHILRDAKRAFPFVNPNCIQIDTLKNLERCKEYIRGIKNNPDKEVAAKCDKEWRILNNIENIYSTSGQVQTARNNY